MLMDAYGWTERAAREENTPRTIAELLQYRQIRAQMGEKPGGD